MAHATNKQSRQLRPESSIIPEEVTIMQQMKRWWKTQNKPQLRHIFKSRMKFITKTFWKEVYYEFLILLLNKYF